MRHSFLDELAAKPRRGHRRRRQIASSHGSATQPPRGASAPADTRERQRPRKITPPKGGGGAGRRDRTSCVLGWGGFLTSQHSHDTLQATATLNSGLHRRSAQPLTLCSGTAETRPSLPPPTHNTRRPGLSLCHQSSSALWILASSPPIFFTSSSSSESLRLAGQAPRYCRPSKKKDTRRRGGSV